jgi:hypothetical protein
MNKLLNGFGINDSDYLVYKYEKIEGWDEASRLEDDENNKEPL